jgi:diaminopimelate epimerase
MALRNADGSRAEMSGNGIRCLAQAVARSRGLDTLDLVVSTDDGPRRLRVRPGPDRDTAWVEVDMGPARPGPEIPALPGLVEAVKAVTVDMGNPHLVLLVDDTGAVDLDDLGPACQQVFDRGINVEIVAPTPGRPNTLDLRVWERGVGLTQACGTGACAGAHAAHQWGVVGERVVIRMPGGEVEVALGAALTLAGPATYVADIEVPA